MRAFMLLSVIAVASAGRLGYNYQQGVSGSKDFVSAASGLNSALSLGNGQALENEQRQGLGLGNGQGQGLGNVVLGVDFGGQAQASDISFGLNGGSVESGLGGAINFGSGVQSFGSGSSESSNIGWRGSGINYGSSGSVEGGVSYQPETNRVIDGGLNKEYYIFSAPEEHVQEGHNEQSISTVIKKNLRVIFIKAPENNGVQNAALQIAKQASEDRTAIYVLSKEPDVSEIASQVQEISENVRAKPEVRFIKYRTAEDALNAQRSIQHQYDSLGGTSQSSDEGVAPVLNFASPAESVQHGGNAEGQSQVINSGSNLIAAGSSLNPATSSISSQNVDFGNIGLSSNNVGVKSGSEYLPPGLKK